MFRDNFKNSLLQIRFHCFTEKYIALYPYNSAEPDDLCFDQNDVIKVIKKDSEWWTGILNGKTRVFPSNYVQKVEYQVIVSSNNQVDDF